MRYFLTKLTFNNHFDWLYMGNGKFCFFKEKKSFKSNQVGNILSIVTFSVFYGDLNYISVCLFEGFLTIFWSLVGGGKVGKWRQSREAGINFNFDGGVVVCRLITQRLETALTALVCVQNFIDIVCERERRHKNIRLRRTATSKVDSLDQDPA